jgi:hypothetical protein
VSPLRRFRKEENSTSKRRDASRIEIICCFLIAWIANKILPSYSAELIEDRERIGGMVGG